jgi:hypothetical protein
MHEGGARDGSIHDGAQAVAITIIRQCPLLGVHREELERAVGEYEATWVFGGLLWLLALKLFDNHLVWWRGRQVGEHHICQVDDGSQAQAAAAGGQDVHWVGLAVVFLILAVVAHLWMGSTSDKWNNQTVL